MSDSMIKMLVFIFAGHSLKTVFSVRMGLCLCIFGGCYKTVWSDCVCVYLVAAV